VSSLLKSYPFDVTMPLQFLPVLFETMLLTTLAVSYEFRLSVLLLISTVPLLPRNRDPLLMAPPLPPGALLRLKVLLLIRLDGHHRRLVASPRQFAPTSRTA
jgi:hypothetical protein